MAAPAAEHSPPSTACSWPWPRGCRDLQCSPSPQQGQTQAKSKMAAEGRGKPPGQQVSPNLPVLNPLPIAHHSAGTALVTPQTRCSRTSPSTTMPGHIPSVAPQPPSGHRGAAHRGTVPAGMGGRAQGAGGAAVGPYLSQGGRGTELWRGAAGAGAHPASSRPILGRGSSGSAEAETTAPPAPASIGPIKSHSEPLEPPALLPAPQGQGWEEGASLMSCSGPSVGPEALPHPAAGTGAGAVGPGWASQPARGSQCHGLQVGVWGELPGRGAGCAAAPGSPAPRAVAPAPAAWPPASHTISQAPAGLPVPRGASAGLRSLCPGTAPSGVTAQSSPGSAAPGAAPCQPHMLCPSLPVLGATAEPRAAQGPRLSSASPALPTALSPLQ